MYFAELKALILNNNNLKSVEGIEKLSSLNALGKFYSAECYEHYAFMVI